jgi:hypothetical protein
MTNLINLIVTENIAGDSMIMSKIDIFPLNRGCGKYLIDWWN